LVLVFATPCAFADWYPPRPIYDYEKAAGRDCSNPETPAADHGRCGPVDGPVFNSFVDTPSYGDERAFFDGRLADAAPNTNRNVIDVPNGGRDVTLRIYINNNANEDYGHRTTAVGTRVRVALPTGSARALRARASIAADNATPQEIEDTADLVSDVPFELEYVPGTARLLRGTDEYPLPDEIVDQDGTLIGEKDMNGIFPAGFNKAALVELTVRTVPTDISDSGARLPLAIGIAALLSGLVAFLYRARVAASDKGVLLLRRTRADPLLVQIVGGVVVAAIVAMIGLLIAGVTLVLKTLL
jgi:hypothetical protein